MKLQKLPSRKSGDKTYYKFIICVPPKAVDEMGWEAGDELEYRVKGSTFILVSATLRDADKSVAKDTPTGEEMIKTVVTEQPTAPS